MQTFEGTTNQNENQEVYSTRPSNYSNSHRHLKRPNKSKDLNSSKSFTHTSTRDTRHQNSFVNFGVQSVPYADFQDVENCEPSYAIN